VHFLRNVLAQVPKGSAEMVAAAIRTIFAQPDAAQVREQLGVIAGMLGRQSGGDAVVKPTGTRAL
jgi:putative transposase